MRHALLLSLVLLCPVTAWGTEHCVRKVIDCQTLSHAACSDEVLTALGHDGATLTLKAATPTDTVHGHVTIRWEPPPLPSLVCVTYYDHDEPSNRKHQSTLKKPATIPSKATVQVQLDSLTIK